MPAAGFVHSELALRGGNAGAELDDVGVVDTDGIHVVAAQEAALVDDGRFAELGIRHAGARADGVAEDDTTDGGDVVGHVDAGSLETTSDRDDDHAFGTRGLAVAVDGVVKLFVIGIDSEVEADAVVVLDLSAEQQVDDVFVAGHVGAVDVDDVVFDVVAGFVFIRGFEPGLDVAVLEDLSEGFAGFGSEGDGVVVGVEEVDRESSHSVVFLMGWVGGLAAVVISEVHCSYCSTIVLLGIGDGLGEIVDRVKDLALEGLETVVTAFRAARRRSCLVGGLASGSDFRADVEADGIGFEDHDVVLAKRLIVDVSDAGDAVADDADLGVGSQDVVAHIGDECPQTSDSSAIGDADLVGQRLLDNEGDVLAHLLSPSGVCV